MRPLYRGARPSPSCLSPRWSNTLACLAWGGRSQHYVLELDLPRRTVAPAPSLPHLTVSVLCADTAGSQRLKVRAWSARLADSPTPRPWSITTAQPQPLAQSSVPAILVQEGQRHTVCPAKPIHHSVLPASSRHAHPCMQAQLPAGSVQQAANGSISDVLLQCLDQTPGVHVMETASESKLPGWQECSMTSHGIPASSALPVCFTHAVH